VNVTYIKVLRHLDEGRNILDQSGYHYRPKSNTLSADP